SARADEPRAQIGDLAEERRRRDAGHSVDPLDTHRELIGVAPGPIFARLDRADDRMLAALRVRRGVTTGRIIATTDVAALQADPQVEPLAAGRKTVLATVDLLGQLGDVNMVEVRARCHASLILDGSARAGLVGSV